MAKVKALKKCSCSMNNPSFKTERLDENNIQFWVGCDCGKRTSTYIADKINDEPVKEWNGSRTTSNMPPHIRPGSPDDFQTPENEPARLFPWVPKSMKILEPACGKGKIVRAFEAGGYDIHGQDIKDGHDFLFSLAALPDFDCIITNPPFSKKNEFLARCYELGKPFILLMPITALVEQERISMWKKHGTPRLLYPPARINFETPSGEGSGASFYCVWFAHGFATMTEPHIFL